MPNWTNNFPTWGDTGASPPSGKNYSGGEQVNEKHFDYLWDQLNKTFDEILTHTIQDDGSVPMAGTLDMDGNAITDGAGNTISDFAGTNLSVNSGTIDASMSFEDLSNVELIASGTTTVSSGGGIAIVTSTISLSTSPPQTVIGHLANTESNGSYSVFVGDDTASSGQGFLGWHLLPYAGGDYDIAIENEGSEDMDVVYAFWRITA